MYDQIQLFFDSLLSNINAGFAEAKAHNTAW